MAEDVHIMKVMKIVMFLLSFFTKTSLTGKTLFTSEDPVTQLSASTIKGTIHGSEEAWFVEFYSSWCGHCIRFAPKWKQLAREVHEWGSIIKIAAIDCAQEENMPVCRDYDIQGYPSLKFFPANAPPVELGAEYKGTREVADMKKAMLDVVEHQSASNRPRSWPKFHVLQNLEDIWTDVRPGVKYHIVLFEQSKSSLGKQVIMDFLDNEKVMIRRMLKENIAHFGIKDYPSAYLIDQGGTFEKLAYNADSDVAAFESELRESLAARDEGMRELQADRKTHTRRPGMVEDGEEELKVALYPDGVHSQDLESGLTYALRHEVASRQLIQGDVLYALKAFVLVLSKHFPGNIPTIRFLKKLNGWLQDQEGPITGEDWLTSLNGLQTVTAYLSPTVQYTGCLGSSPQYRQYPCSLWTLFHALTVNAAQDKMEDFEPREVLLAMKGYIGQFFGCRECNDNFQKMAATIKREVSDADDAILWLWRAHNKANKRLHRDASEDPDHPKVQFPPSAMCQTCWITLSGKLTWDEQETLKYLKQYYGRENIIQDSQPYEFKPSYDIIENDNAQLKFKAGSDKFHPKDTRLKPIKDVDLDLETDLKNHKKLMIQGWKDKEKSSRYIHSKASASWGITTVDISICVLFYFICTAIIILGYFHLSVHRRISIFDLCKKSRSQV